jgi:predicted dehydrogenase
MEKLTTAVVGVGSLGQHHARILSQHPASSLVAVVDNDLKRAEKIASGLHVPACKDHHDVIGKARLAVIAVPTPFHFSIAKDLIGAGIHVLVEKPFTETVEQAKELIALAEAKSVILQVGLVERFNPAVISAQQYINKPKFIEVNRLGPYDPRTSHIGVVMDLMIHDIDIVLSLIREKVISVEAHGASILSEHEDIVKARIKFEGGCVADISASRVSLEKYRKIRLFQADSYISIDYAGKSLKVYRKKQPVVRSLLDIEVTSPKLKNEEQLFLELDHFITCVIEGRKPEVTGEHGRDALELALEILRNLTNQ